jgi:hypothetical protein
VLLNDEWRTIIIMPLGKEEVGEDVQPKTGQRESMPVLF